MKLIQFVTFTRLGIEPRISFIFSQPLYLLRKCALITCIILQIKPISLRALILYSHVSMIELEIIDFQFCKTNHVTFY